MVINFLSGLLITIIFPTYRQASPPPPPLAWTIPSSHTVKFRNFTECYNLQKCEISKTFCVEVLVARTT